VFKLVLNGTQFSETIKAFLCKILNKEKSALLKKSRTLITTFKMQKKCEFMLKTMSIMFEKIGLFDWKSFHKKDLKCKKKRVKKNTKLNWIAYWF